MIKRKQIKCELGRIINNKLFMYREGLGIDTKNIIVKLTKRDFTTYRMVSGTNLFNSFVSSLIDINLSLEMERYHD